MTLVVDASVVIAALVDEGSAGGWAAPLLASEPLVAPHLLPAEVTSFLRRAVLSGRLSEDLASLALADLSMLPIELFPFAGLAQRAWQLRDNLTVCDGWYVALAESLGSPLATADLRLSRAPGPRCDFLVPPA